MSDNMIALAFALIALATRLIDYLKDKWDTAHRIPVVQEVKA